MGATREFAAGSRYIQGPGALARLWELGTVPGGRVVAVVDHHVLDLLSQQLTVGAPANSLILPFSGEITAQAIDALEAAAGGVDAVIAIGGGKAIDAGKALALRRLVPVMTVPTIASSDAPVSRGIAIYDDDHRMAVVLQLPANPHIVLVDTDVIAAAPPRYLSAGIGDALAKKFEAEAADASGALNKHGTLPLLTGLIAADGCYRVLRRHAVGAMNAARLGQPDKDLEATVEACFLLAALGFENTGLSMAHSVTRGLVRARQVGAVLHGFHVAYGLLVQFAAEGRVDAEITDLRSFLASVGLPRTLAEMGMSAPSRHDFEAMLDPILASPHIRNVPREVDRTSLLEALERIETFHPA